MRYWAHINNEVCGPFEKEKLPGLAKFGPDSFICPETADGGQTAAWKPASAFPEVLAALSPAPSPLPPRQAAEATLGMTMRGTIIELTQPKEQAAPPPKPLPAAVIPMKPAGEAAARRDSGQQAEPLDRKFEQMNVLLASIAESQARLLGKVDGLERAMAEMKTLLLPKPPQAK
ncbi:MAG: hypothetical protein A2016_12000 [Elusimicrobia bacterium GWF2_62_30]|nr:MAG: hypothetical protein A2016_12000 [Elusimicrobia bacterium GWF2_62_30]